MNRKTKSPAFILAAAAMLSSAIATANSDLADKSRTASGAKPNVIVILADDMGNGDISAYGNKLIDTKNIDSIGKDGVTFTSGYVSAPLCSPSRAGMVTGRYQQRFGFEQQVSSGAFPEMNQAYDMDGKPNGLIGEEESLRRGVPLTEKNIGELFKAGDYNTGIVGKWHLGHGEQFLPQNRGFDYSNVFYGNTSLQIQDLSNPDYISLKVDFHDEAPVTAWTRAGLNQIRENGKIVQVNQYLLDHFRDRAIDFIEDNKNKPFMLYMAMNSPVPPLQVPIGYFEKLRKKIPNINERAYNGLVLAQDDAVGAVLEKLKATGLDQNTIVVFLSDNGEAESRPGSNAPYQGGKYSTHEGGIRVPFMMKWPGHIKPGSVYDKPVISLDILPTVAAAGGVSTKDAKPLDGKNLLPFLEAKNDAAPHEALFWKLGQESAVRKGAWKLWLNTSTGSSALYRVSEDVAETKDLSAQHPDIKSELQASYDAWNKELPVRGWTNVSPVFKK